MKRDPSQIEDVLAKIDMLEPQEAEERARPALALSRLRAQPKPQSRWTRFWAQRRQPLTGYRRFALAATLILIFAIAFSFPGVRVAAGEFLGTFRVGRFAPISISPEQIALLEELVEKGFTPGEFEQIGTPGEMEPAGSATAASELAGFEIRLPESLADPNAFQVARSGDIRFIIDLEGSRAIMEAAGIDPQLLPDNVDGEAVEVEAYPGVTTLWEEGIVLFQTPSPQVTYPAGVDLNVLGQAALQFLGMSELEAAAAAATIDWTSTFVLPIPTELATYEEVAVDGVSGLIIKSLDGMVSGVIWQKNGIVYILSAEAAGAERLLAIANSLD